MTCKCKVDGVSLTNIDYEQCPLHAAAEEMLGWLKSYRVELIRGGTKPATLQQVTETIAKAEGKKEKQPWP